MVSDINRTRSVGDQPKLYKGSDVLAGHGVAASDDGHRQRRVLQTFANEGLANEPSDDEIEEPEGYLLERLGPKVLVETSDLVALVPGGGAVVGYLLNRVPVARRERADEMLDLVMARSQKSPMS